MFSTIHRTILLEIFCIIIESRSINECMNDDNNDDKIFAIILLSTKVIKVEHI